jgi:hypothetical protein
VRGGLQPAARGGVRKHQVGQGLPIQLACPPGWGPGGRGVNGLRLHPLRPDLAGPFGGPSACRRAGRLAPHARAPPRRGPTVWPQHAPPKGRDDAPVAPPPLRRDARAEGWGPRRLAKRTPRPAAPNPPTLVHTAWAMASASTMRKPCRRS